MVQKTDIKDLFLKAFVSELIKNTNPKNIQLIPFEENPLDNSFKPKTITPGLLASPFEIKRPVVTPRTKLTNTLTRPFTKKLPIPRRKSPQFRAMQAPQENPDLGKLNFIITDPRVQGLECPGPNKNIMVKKDGMSRQSQVALNSEEINTIINEFSQKARIPLIKGTFKAALGNLIMTAVISEFVGSRFMIQKKHPLVPVWHH